MTAQPPGVTSIEQAIEMRGQTDTAPSYWVHVVLPPALVALALLIVGGVLYALLSPVPLSLTGIANRVTDRLLGGLVGLIGLSLVAATVLGYVGYYRLLRRRNDHLGRDRILRRGLLDYCRRLAETSEGERAGEHLETMERLHNEALMEETDQPPAVHIVLQVVFSLWYFYILYILLKDFPRHARRQARFVQAARSLFEETGLDPEELPAIDPVDERSYMLAVVLLIPPWGLVGAFVVHWWLYEDPMEHFVRQWAHEDALLATVGDRPAPPAPDPEASQGPADEGPAPDEENGDDEGAPQPDRAQGEDAGESEAPAFTVWECGECGKKYKVPPKRPVRVTCKNCGNKEILEE